MTNRADQIPVASKPRRRWLQFNLRTLFVIVTAASCCLGWFGHQWRTVQLRQATLARIDACGGGYITSLGVEPGTQLNGISVRGCTGCGGAEPGWLWVFDAMKADVRQSALRRWLGDRVALAIWLPETTPPDDAEAIKAAFPEARFQWRPEDKPLDSMDN